MPFRLCYVAHANQHYVPPYVDFFHARGCEVHVVSLHPADVPNAINHHPFRCAFDPMRDKWMYPFAIHKVRRMVRRIQPDVVHAHYLTTNGLLAALAGVHPLVTTAHGSDVFLSMKGRLRRRLIRFAMDRAELVNTVSGALARDIRSLGVDPRKVVELTLGIVADRFNCDRSTRRSGPVRLICTRNLYPLYSCETILRALSELHREAIEFECTMAGRGPEQQALQAFTVTNRLSSHVRFLSGYGASDLPALLADADIYLSASLSDGASLSLLEAMASGVFPVVSDIPANREWIRGRGDGMLFTPGDHRALAECLRETIADAPMWRAAVECNRETVRRRGDRETNMAILAEHYERLIHD